MFLVDMDKKVIHDMSFVRYECAIQKIPEDKRKKIYSLETIKRMVDSSAVPRFNGCQHCMSDMYQVDFTKLFQ